MPTLYARGDAEELRFFRGTARRENPRTDRRRPLDFGLGVDVVRRGTSRSFGRALRTSVRGGRSSRRGAPTLGIGSRMSGGDIAIAPSPYDPPFFRRRVDSEAEDVRWRRAECSRAWTLRGSLRGGRVRCTRLRSSRAQRVPVDGDIRGRSSRRATFGRVVSAGRWFDVVSERQPRA